MSAVTPGFKTYTAGANLAKFTIVKPYAAARQVVPAAAATDALIGTVGELSPASGQRVDVLLGGLGYVVAGAAIAAGAPLTSDASGAAVTAAPAAGANARIVGFALEAASAAGDIIQYRHAPGFMQG